MIIIRKKAFFLDYNPENAGFHTAEIAYLEIMNAPISALVIKWNSMIVINGCITTI